VGYFRDCLSSGICVFHIGYNTYSIQERKEGISFLPDTGKIKIKDTMSEPERDIDHIGVYLFQ
jgi:hypothetical protein